MSFPLGKPILALTAAAVLTGLMLAWRPSRPAADLTVWTFTPADAAADRAAAAVFAGVTGNSVRVDLVAAPALDVRLSSLLMADLRPATDSSRPDVVELEVGSVGKFLRGPPDEIGFLPLDGYLRRGGWADKIVASRLVPYSYSGHVFGIPLDLHPVTLVYRRDLIDLSAAQTWADLQAECLRYQRSSGGHFTISLSATSADTLLVMLQQRHVELVDANLTPHLTDAAVADTVCWYARAVAGPDRIAADVNPAPGGAAADLVSGDVAAVVVADWAVADLERSAPQLMGRLAMAPLPRFAPGDAPTASWGGTMAGIPRFCPDPDRAWRLVEQTYLIPAAVATRWRATGALPPQQSAWADDMFHQPDPFFAGQRVTELYIRLATQLPRRAMTPYTIAAQNQLAWVLNRAAAHVRSGDQDLKNQCQHWLADRQAQLQRLLKFDQRVGQS